MSIIRSNIARQLLAEGGAPRKGFARGSGRGRTDADTMTGSGYTSSFDDGFDTGEEFGRDTYADQLSDLQRTENTFPNISNVSGGDLSNISIRPDGTSGAPSIIDFTPLGIIKRLDERFLKPGRDKYNIARRTEFLRRKGLIGPGEEELPVEYQDAFLSSPAGLEMLRGMGYTTIQDVINKGEGGDSEPIKRLRAPITEKIEEKPKLSDIENLLRLRGSAFEDGGEVRQEYGLGSIVKKATRAVKKVAKSPLGKAALIAGIGAYGLGAGPFAKGSTMFGGKLAGLKGSGFLKSFLLKDAASPFALDNISPFGAITAASLLAGGLSKQDEEEEETIEKARSDPEFANLINYMGGSRRFAEDGGDIEDAPMKTASMPSSFGELNQLSIDLFGRPYDQLNDSEQEILIEYFTKGKKQGIERATAAMGGMMEKDEMLDLGGKEMDLRGGGFVPIGEYEKKDDVPARLSKNEFVFTADAVRAAGGGSVDKGADLMYKTMKTLENKVA